jgi:halimadienyl-diphosphate synthase
MLINNQTKVHQSPTNTSLNNLIKQLLQEIGPGYEITTSAYDTAWLARLVELNEPIGYEALNWLRANQLEDGSWGASEPLYYHDRVICTLSAIITLEKYGDDSDVARIDRALPVFYDYLEKLDLDPAGETIAFEMLLPALMAEGKAMGLLPPGGTGQLNTMALTRDIKLSKAPGRMISRFVTMAHSAEMVGRTGLHILDIDNLQENNGSIGYSPAATAFFALYVKRQDKKALEYLRDASINGSMPYVFPIDAFERGWVLWNLALLNSLDNEILELCNPHLNFLEDNWQPGVGIPACVDLSFIDADSTSLIKEVLAKFDRSADLNAVLQHEKDEYFRCYGLEANPSISTNIHVLGALRAAGLKTDNSSVKKILRFLQKEKNSAGYWLDKWHASPFYPTSHAIITLSGYSNELAKDAITWILESQNADGSWGFYMPTAEETAYCLQALAIWKQNYGTVPFGVIERGIYWLVNHMDLPYPPLWIGKSLYSPILVVRSAILGALAVASQISITPSKNGVNFSDN